MGKSPQGKLSIYKRRAIAIERAYDNAIERAVDLILKYRLKQAQKDRPDYILDINIRFLPNIRKSIRKHTINGDIIQKKFYSDGSCSIIYRIQRPGLMKILEKIPIPIITKGVKN